MTGTQKKQMLYVSLQDIDADPCLRFEIEPYYRRQTRRIFTEDALLSLDRTELLKDEEFLKELGFSFTLRLLLKSRVKEYKEGGPCWTLIAYPHQRNGNPVVRIDEEHYTHKPHRRYCGTLPLPTLDNDIANSDKELKIKIAKTVLEFLPLHGWEEVQELA